MARTRDISVERLAAPALHDHPAGRPAVKNVWSVVVLAAVSLLSPPILAQSPQSPLFKSTADVVALNVAVQDGRAKYVTDLTPQDFAVLEDGVPQEVRFFESTAVPVDLIVLLDTSASMGDRLDLVRAAANGFVRTLRPGDRGAVVTFSDDVGVRQPLTGDVPALIQAVTAIHAEGATALNNAIYIALKTFGLPARQEGQVRRQAIAVLSDGVDTASLVSSDDVIALARRMGVSIYTVGLRSQHQAQEEANRRGGRRYYSDADYTLTNLARETGALSFFPTIKTLKDVYASIATELATQYSIGYVPTNTSADGRFRRVVVQVVSRPELRARTRLGYTPAPSVPTADLRRQ